MKFIAIAFIAVVALVAADQAADQAATVVRSDSEVSPTGFKYNYETSHGIQGEATGAVKQVGEETPVTQQGSYKFTSPEGKTYTVSYVADENGFQPTGDHLPVAPAVPEAIARALKFIAEHPASEE